MERKVYFGNANKQLWIPAPRTGLDASPEGYFNQTQLLSGRAFQKRSAANHRQFLPTWVGSLNTENENDSLHTIKDYFDGLHGAGPFYWLDPYAVETNLLAPNWAAPMLSQAGWSSISTVGAATTVATATNTRSYPYEALRLTFTASVQESTKVNRIILPANYKLHFGWHGEQNSGDATIVLRCYPRSGGTAVDISTIPIAVTSATRTNTQVNGDTYYMVEVLVKNPSASTSVIDISGMIAQVRPETDTVPTGSFISGRGTQGLLFASAPKISYLSAKVNEGYVELATSFIEE
jgi:hypothetical protein